MPPKRRNKTPHAANLAPQSDYDTDAGTATDLAMATQAPITTSISTSNSTNTAAPAPLPPQTNEELNIAVLRRHNPSIQQIVSLANFAVVYLFSPESEQWEKCGIEGTLFTCALAPHQFPLPNTNTNTNADEEPTQTIERYNVTILNRRGLENFSHELLSAEDVEITDEYVILQVAGEDAASAPQIYGLWIFSEPAPSSTAETRLVNARIIYECARRAGEGRAAAAAAAAALKAQQQQQQQVAGEGAVEAEGRDLGVGPQFDGAGEEDGEVRWQVQRQMQQQQQQQMMMMMGVPPVQMEQHLQQLRQQQQQQQMQQQQQYQQHQQHQQQQQQQYYMGHEHAYQQPSQAPAQADVLGHLFQRARQGYTG